MLWGKGSHQSFIVSLVHSGAWPRELCFVCQWEPLGGISGDGCLKPGQLFFIRDTWKRSICSRVISLPRQNCMALSSAAVLGGGGSSSLSFFFPVPNHGAMQNNKIKAESLISGQQWLSLLKKKNPCLGSGAQQCMAAASATANGHREWAPSSPGHRSPFGGVDREVRQQYLHICPALFTCSFEWRPAFCIENLAPTLIPLASYPRRAGTGSLALTQTHSYS